MMFKNVDYSSIGAIFELRIRRERGKCVYPRGKNDDLLKPSQEIL